MATTSTVPAVKSQIVGLVGAAVPVPVTYAWPGPATENECVFLGPHPQTADIRLDVESSIPTVKAGRKARQENYTIRVTVWTFRPDLTVEGAQACETRAFDLLSPIEDVFADDPAIGLSELVQWVNIESVSSTLFPFNAGWACELGVDVAVRARLA